MSQAEAQIDEDYHLEVDLNQAEHRIDADYRLEVHREVDFVEATRREEHRNFGLEDDSKQNLSFDFEFCTIWIGNSLGCV